ncbi:MAG: MtnX-like HAD-IB family phosphatase [Thermoplasmata archaeon]|nr:MtnX-like HAD-IB family phosphatase [Thermoplasmata archaeon]
MVSEYTVLCDFDGTITERDVAASIIKEFSTVDWKEIEDRYIAGTITSREELAEQFSHIDASEEMIFDLINKDMKLDPTFTYFRDFCKMNDIPITIVSEGLGFYIDHMFLAKGIDIPTRANEGVFMENNTIQMKFLTDPGNANSGNAGPGDVICGKCGNCKSSYLEEQKGKGKTVIYIGDGRSDFCPAKKADIVFAKKSLAIYLRSENVEHNPFNRFSDIVAMMEELI